MTRAPDRPPWKAPPLDALDEELRHEGQGPSPKRSEAPLSARPVAIGDLVAGRYTVLRRLGAGAHGSVFAVRRKADGEELALKLLRPEEPALGRTRFAREARALATIRHPNVVAVRDVGVTEGGQMYLVMELLEGRDLASHKQRYQDVPWMVPILAQVAAGLSAVHEKNIVHRDLKPLNIVLTPADADAPSAKLVDFGIARLAQGATPDEAAGASRAPPDGAATTPPPDDPTAPRSAVHQTHAGVVVGTPVFLAPELHAQPGQVTPAVDIFAFGVLAHKVLTDLLPFAEPPMLIFAREGRLPELVPLQIRCPQLSAEASSLLMRCLGEDPAARPAAAEVAEKLKERGLT